jgi:tetratricopeptide (TPR) repeat protein
LKQAVDLDHQSAETYYTLGFVLYYLERCEEAIPFFNQALAIEPESQQGLDGIRMCLEAESGN